MYLEDQIYLNLGKLINPMEFNRLPRVVHGFDRINKTQIKVPSGYYLLEKIKL